MKSEKRYRESSGAECVLFLVLVVLLVFRWFFLEDGEADIAITVVNFVGMEIALFSLLVQMFSRTETKGVRRLGVCLNISIVVAAVIVSMMLVFGKITFSQKTNDCVTIAALLFALPSNWLCEVLFDNGEKCV